MFRGRRHDSIAQNLAQKSYYGFTFPILTLHGFRKSYVEHAMSVGTRTCEFRFPVSVYRANEVSSMDKFINDENWYRNLIRARHLEPHARYVRPMCIHSRQMDVSQGTHPSAPEDPRMALYVSEDFLTLQSCSYRLTCTLGSIRRFIIGSYDICG